MGSSTRRPGRDLLAVEEPADLVPVRRLDEPECVREHVPLPELELEALTAGLEVHPIPLPWVEHGLGEDAVQGAGAVPGPISSSSQNHTTAEPPAHTQ